MSEPPPPPPSPPLSPPTPVPPPPPSSASAANGRTTAVLIIGAIVVIAVLAVGSVLRFRSSFRDEGPPSCDAEPVTLGWTTSDRGWRRTSTFTLDERQTVQVDVRLFATDGGVIQLGSTIYAVPAGEPFPEFGESASTTEPFRGVRVGSGREAVNEQVRLDAGTWELMTNGGAGPADVRWPC